MGVVISPPPFATPAHAVRTRELFSAEARPEDCQLIIALAGPRFGPFRDDTFERAREYFPGFLRQISSVYGVAAGQFVLVDMGHNGEFGANLALVTSPGQLRAVVVVPSITPLYGKLREVHDQLGLKIDLVISSQDERILSGDTARSLIKNGVVIPHAIPTESMMDGGLRQSIPYVLRIVADLSS